MKQKMLTHNRRFLYKLIPAAPEAGVKEADALECAVSAGSLRVAAGGAGISLFAFLLLHHVDVILCRRYYHDTTVRLF